MLRWYDRVWVWVKTFWYWLVVVALVVGVALWGWFRPIPSARANTPVIVIPTPSVKPTPSVAPTRTPTALSISELTVKAMLKPMATPVVAAVLPTVTTPDPRRQKVFPDVPHQGRPALVGYERPFEDGDYFETGVGDIDLPQWYYRVITAGKIRIPQLGIDCEGSANKGCSLILINQYGLTAIWRRAEVDNGFTVAGRVFDMSTPEKVTLAAQALLDHVIYRMTVQPNDGANCSILDGCPSVEWHVVVIGDGKPVAHWFGLFRR